MGFNVIYALESSPNGMSERINIIKTSNIQMVT